MAEKVTKVTKETKETSPYLDISQVGGEGGGPFEYLGDGHKGQMLSTIEVWVGEKTIIGVKIVLTNGYSNSFGRMDGAFDEFSFQRGELITEMSLWENKEDHFEHPRIAAIRFKTNEDREFFPKMKNKDLGYEYRIEVGSGICVGVIGRSGSDIDKIGFQFIKPLKSSVMSNVTYPDLALKQVKINIDALDSVVYNNDLEVEQTFTHETSVTTTKKQSWSKTSNFEFAFSIRITVEASIPFLTSSKVETESSLKESNSDTYGMENSETKEVTWTFPFKIPAKSNVAATVSRGKADIDIQYKGKLVMTTMDGCQLSFDVDGTYYGVAFTDVAIAIKKV